MEISESQLRCINQCLKWLPAKLPSAQALLQTRLVAHRGRLSWKSLENSLPSFRQCLDAHIWAIEFDIRWTEDNEPVIHHDASLSRVFAKDFEISRHPWTELRNFEPKVPHLKEVIDELGGKIHFFIELKTPLSLQQKKRLLKLLENLSPVEDYHIMGFDLNTLSQLQELPARTRVAIINTRLEPALSRVHKENWGGLTGHYMILRKKVVTQLQDRNVCVGTGFPDEKNLFFREVNKGVHWVFTNEAKRLQKLKQNTGLCVLK